MRSINKQLKKDSKLNLLFFLVPFVLFFAYKNYQHSFVKRGNYTIGYIYKIYWPLISHKKINYSYTANGLKYEGSDIFNSKKKPLEHKRYLVRYAIQNPKESDILQDIPIPDSIKTAPLGGWKELPEWTRK